MLFYYHNLFLTSPLASMAVRFSTSSLYIVFLTTSVFTIPLSLLQLTGVVSNSSMSNLSVSDLKLAKTIFLANYDVSTSFVLLKSDFLA